MKTTTKKEFTIKDLIRALVIAGYLPKYVLDEHNNTKLYCPLTGKSLTEDYIGFTVTIDEDD